TLGQPLDRIAAVAEDAVLAVNEGDRAPATGGVEERRIVAQQPGTGSIRGDLLEIGGGDRAIPDRDLVAAAGPVVGDGQRLFCHGSPTLSASSHTLESARALSRFRKVPTSMLAPATKKGGVRNEPN